MTEELNEIKIPVKIRIVSRQREEQFVPQDPEETEEQVDNGPNVTEMYAEGTLLSNEKRIAVLYDETELTGMEGTRTRLFFAKQNPGMVSLSRDGTVKTALHFETGRQHITVYQTPYLTCELCVHTYELENRLSSEGGTLHLRYDLKISGVCLEKTDLFFEATPILH